MRAAKRTERVREGGEERTACPVTGGTGELSWDKELLCEEETGSVEKCCAQSLADQSAA